MEIPKSSLERAQTDDSLRGERERRDRESAKGRDLIAQVADDVLRHARLTADAVLLDARDRADRLFDGSNGSVLAGLAIASERRAEDATVRDDRDAADETLEFERVETQRLLSLLIPQERQLTDDHLQAERVRSDGAVANRDDFLGVVTHDLRDLLGAIAMSTAVIRNTAAPTECGAAIGFEVARIQRHVARASRLISDLVDVASIDAGRLAINMTPNDLATLLAEVAEEFHASGTIKGIEMHVECDPAVLVAMFDHARMFQVLSNLVSNAIKFSARGTRIELRGECVGEQLQCSVRDQGPGIPADRVESVFERFSQVKENDHRGLGLGLFIAKRIVDGHGGKIWAESRIGHGTSVLFTIPMSGV